MGMGMNSGGEGKEGEEWVFGGTRGNERDGGFV